MIIERQSVVDAPAEQVWARVVTPEGINDELRPWMTDVDAARRGIADRRQCADRHADRPRWLRLFGVLPFDYDRLCIAELWPGADFDEESTMMSMRRWRHERSVDARTVTRKPLCAIASRLELRGRCVRLTPIVAAGLARAVRPPAPTGCSGISPVLVRCRERPSSRARRTASRAWSRPAS